MANYLFFRTDRIGDFLVSAILIKSIKRNDKNSHITVIASNKNFYYIKTLNFIDEVILYPENFLKKILLYLKLRKKNYEMICALDGKKRSIYFSIFLKSKKKILMTTKFLYKKLLNSFFFKIYFFDKSKDKIYEIIDVLELNQMNFINKDIYFLLEQKLISTNIKLIDNYVTLHFDEKWIFDHYIKKYKSIEPDVKGLELFVKNLVEKTNQNLIITTGLQNNDILDNFLINFKKINDNLYERNLNKNTIHVFINIDFFDLNYIIKNTKFIITCHGASTHLASAHNIKIFDIFDKSQEKSYQKWVGHINNYNFFYRENFNELTNKILNQL